MPSYEKGHFVVLLRDGSSFQIISDDWRHDPEAKAFRFFDVDETEEGPKNHEVAFLSELDVLGVAEAERISRRRSATSTSTKSGRDPEERSARRKAATRRTEE